MSNPETIIQNAWLLRNGQRKDLMVWRNQTGKYRHITNPNLIISVGVPGAPDALGVQAVKITEEMVGKVIGMAVAPEFKTLNGRQSAEQKAWQSAFELRGGLYRLIRSAEDAL